MSELVIALDYPDAPSALNMAQTLAGTGVWAKVGMELFTASGPSIINDLKELGFKVFLDLKFKDIPNTVAGAVRSAARAGADMINVHTTGGTRMMQAARQALDSLDMEHPPILLGVTVLTSMDESDLSLAPGQTVADLVLLLARAGKDAGLDGVVCSGFEAAAIKERCGADFICLTPGIRPAGEDAGDQRRVMTPQRAVRAGADYLVVGRPITGAKDPLSALRTILEQMG